MKTHKKGLLAVIAVCGLLGGIVSQAGASSLSVTSLITPGLDGTGMNARLLDSNARGLSRDGRITVFATLSTNHTPNDTNEVNDVFAYDKVTKKTELISHNAQGRPANGESAWPTVSADGRYIAYFSSATDIVPDIASNCPRPNQCGMVIVHDRTTQQNVVANRDENGIVVPSTLYDKPSISGNGRFVAFAKRIDNPGLPTENIFLRDLQANTTTLISADTSGNPVRTFSGEPTLSYDGHFATFTTAAQATPEDTNEVNDVYLRNTRLGQTTLISQTQHIVRAGNSSSSGGVISNDGHFIAFHSFASDLTPGDTRGYRDVFLRNLATGTTQRISLNRSGMQGNYGSYDPDISDDGRFIAYGTDSNNLVPADTNSRPDILLFDRFAGITRRINVSSHDGPEANQYSDWPVISGDAKTVIFRSRATNLIPPATGPSTNNLYQVYNPVVYIPYYDPSSVIEFPASKS